MIDFLSPDYFGARRLHPVDVVFRRQRAAPVIVLTYSFGADEAFDLALWISAQRDKTLSAEIPILRVETTDGPPNPRTLRSALARYGLALAKNTWSCP